MIDYKFFIPSAGLGSRLGNLTSNLNKTLLTIGRKPVLSHIIDKVDKDIEIVICVGYQSDIIKQYLSHAYANRKITIVDVDPFEGSDSSLSYTIRCAKEHLQCPFIFCSNDTLISEEFNIPITDYICYDKISNSNDYRTCEVKSDKLVKLFDKNVDEQTENVYIGLCGINNYKKFWECLDSQNSKIGESDYFIKNPLNVVAYRKTWFDTGNIQQLTQTKKKFDQNDGIYILEKTDEAIWFVGDTVIKYHKDPKFISDRIDRIQYVKDYVPEILKGTTNMFSYKKIDGSTFTHNLRHDLFRSFLQKLKKFWQYTELNKEDSKKFKANCLKFYKDKTYDRVKQFTLNDTTDNINGEPYKDIFTILDNVDWSWLSDGMPVRFHGDLHFENVIVTKDDFKFIDWRQDFAGNKEYGDVYYDLAKIKHGLIVSHEIVDKNLFEVSDDMKSFDINRKHILIEFEKIFDDFVEYELNLNLRKVNILTSLIYLNVAVLHHYPYNNFLFCLGKTMLSKLENL